jgi:hypothetical protein
MKKNELRTGVPYKVAYLDEPQEIKKIIVKVSDRLKIEYEKMTDDSQNWQQDDGSIVIQYKDLYEKSVYTILDGEWAYTPDWDIDERVEIPLVDVLQSIVDEMKAYDLTDKNIEFYI